MARRTFLNKEEFSNLKLQFESETFFKNESKKVRQVDVQKVAQFCLLLSNHLFEKLSQLPHWQESCPIALGSWARDEICPQSDIDLIFCGPEDKVLELVREAQEKGLPLRYRVPEDHKDWTVGVDGFDILSLLNARAFTQKGEDLLQEQIQKFLSLKSIQIKSIFRAMVTERKQRSERYDSVASYLEPHLKYGHGALRDLYQALMVTQMFSKKFQNHLNVIQFLDKTKWYFLLLRLRLHFYGASDHLVANFQREVAQWTGYETLRDFMKGLQNTLTQVSFFTDWVIDRAKESEKRYSKVLDKPMNSYSDFLVALKGDSSLLVQERVRFSLMQKGMKNKLALVKPLHKGKLLKKHITISSSDSFIRAIFRSGFLASMIVDLKKVQGLVQHDQYHKFCVDAHLMQCMRRVCQVYRSPKLLGRLSYLVVKLTEEDWEILLWTSLFHDMAKGKQSKSGHSIDGAKLVRKILLQFGFKKSWVEEIAWLVEKHLVLSTAAFRHNPKDPTVWKYLSQQGIYGHRLELLCIFTLIDIHATNPEAWTDWKERLMFELIKTLTSPQVSKVGELLSQAKKQNLELSSSFLKDLDPTLLENLPSRVLIKEYDHLKKKKMSSVPFIWVSPDHDVWIRFFAFDDEPGLMFQFLQLLSESGCQIHRLFIQTFKEYGVYDWFKIKTKSTKKQLLKRLELLSKAPSQEIIRSVDFDDIRLVSETEKEHVVSFRCLNQTGALLSATKLLVDEGFAIKWARSHTWGRQLEAVMGIYFEKDFLKKFQSIKTKGISSSTFVGEFD